MMKNIFLFLAIILFSACSSLPRVVAPSADDSVEIDDVIYVVGHGWHTGFVLPAGLIQSRVPQLKERFPNTRFLEFGWGDKGFYQAREVTSGITLQAIFWPTESVVHVVAVPVDADQFFPQSQVERICPTGSQYLSLIKFIESSFARDDEGRILPEKNGIYGDSQFYQGVGDYYLMNTCNKWTAKGLRSAGMNISPIFKLTAGSILDALGDTHGLRCAVLSEMPIK